jgi:F-type H+-transporting ATPase subunit epsilon
MVSLFHVNIITPASTIYEGDVESMIVPAQTGYMGVLAHHAPIVAQLAPGKITLRDNSGKESVFGLKASGFFEFSANRATFMLDAFELPA